MGSFCRPRPAPSLPRAAVSPASEPHWQLPFMVNSPPKTTCWLPLSYIPTISKAKTTIQVRTRTHLSLQSLPTFHPINVLPHQTFRDAPSPTQPPRPSQE